MKASLFRCLLNKLLRKQSHRSVDAALDRDGARTAMKCFVGTGETSDLWQRFLAHESSSSEIENARQHIIELSKRFPSRNREKFCSTEGFIKIKETVQEIEEMFQAEFREPTNYERAILEFLLKPDFPGVEKLRAQLDGLKVRPLDVDGCLELQVKNYVRQYPLKHMRRPVEATYTPNDTWGGLQPKVHVVLHTDDHDHIMELEFWNEVPCDFRLPQIDELKIEINDTAES